MPVATESRPPIEVFCCYSLKDEAWLQKLETHLSQLQQHGLVSLCYDQPGTNLPEAFDKHLARAPVILLLVSADFLASDYCKTDKMERMLQRRETRVVLPIIVRACHWESSLFAQLQVLPTNRRPITTWDNEDEAWTDVTKGIRNVIISNIRPNLVETVYPSPADDGTLRSHIEKSRRFEKQFSDLWGNLGSALQEVVEEVGRMTTTHNSTLISEYVKEVLTRCRKNTGLPSREDLITARSRLGSYQSAFSFYLNVMRTHLTHHFVDIDDILRPQMDDAKDRVICIFLRKGRLRSLAPGIPEQKFLGWMASQPSLTPRLQKTFQALDRELSVRAFFLYRIRSCLTNLDPDRTPFRPSQPITVDSVIELLTQIHKETVDQLEQNVLGDSAKGTADQLEQEKRGNFAYESSMAIQAIIEEFVGQALSSKNIEEEWKEFYYANHANIWIN